MNNIENLYRQVIMDHYKNPRNKGLKGYPHVHLKNPSCGDDITIEANIENGKIKEVRHNGVGCSICCSSASVLTEVVKDKTVEEGKRVIEKYFSMMGQFVVFCDVTGGSDDGGIDIILETVDGLGFYEKIMVQTKCRDKAQINEKEVREFYGAVNALGGSRGLYVTTTNYHYGAKKLLDSIDNCVGIDGDKLFELIKKTEYGICITKNGFAFDSAIFGS